MNALQNLLGHESGQLIAWIVPIIILALVVPFYRIMRASTELRDRGGDAIKMNSGASLTLGVKSPARESLVVRVNKDVIQRARDLIGAGNDLESVCCEIEPGYANWQIAKQRAFRRAIEMMLTAEPAVQNSTQITSTQPR